RLPGGTYPKQETSMIRFACPACQTALKVSGKRAGAKVACLKCGQRLLVPRPDQLPRKKTLLGRLLPERKSEPAPAAPVQPGATMPCPGCARPVALTDAESAGGWVRCPHCGVLFVARRVSAGPPPGSPPPPKARPFAPPPATVRFLCLACGKR